MLRVPLGRTATEPGQVPSLLPEPRLDPIHLVLAADARYGAWAGIALAAVLRANSGEALDIHVLSDGIARRDCAKLAALARGARAALSVHDVALLDAAKGLAGSHHLSRAAYARLFIDRLLPREIERALYIDCDVLCCGAIRPLWQLGAAVPDDAACEQTDPAERKAALGIPER